SWGVSTRLVGALIMTHSDDNGLVLPPKLAPIQVAIIPIYRQAEQLDAIRQKLLPLIDELKSMGISVVFDDDDNRKPGWKFAEYEMKGVPVRIAMGPRDLENETVEVARRDTLGKEILPFDGVGGHIEKLLGEIQQNLYNKALTYREENTREVDSWEEFQDVIATKGGFVSAHWDGTAETEEYIKQKTKATIRCIPFGDRGGSGKCVQSGKPSEGRVLFAKAY
ncbi:MAG TPA: His/Gly/Thr/Pro-type tRNA ligase C-terminal domain-containing protein, partial [Cryomorphaceae bacterium]|nr:His/Gly/Thr/Pro-type tRNA ligase C-terminal domain-containing protein [Cryomorphaceae bacterium]